MNEIFSSFFFFLTLFYVFIWDAKSGVKVSESPFGSLSKCVKCPGLCQAEDKSQDISLGLWSERQVPN